MRNPLILELIFTLCTTSTMRCRGCAELQVHYYASDDLETPKGASHFIQEEDYDPNTGHQSVRSYHTAWEARSPADITNTSPGVWCETPGIGHGRARKGLTASPDCFRTPGRNPMICKMSTRSKQGILQHTDTQYSVRKIFQAFY